MPGRMQYPQEVVEAAIAEVKAGSSVRYAARKHNVARETLQGWIRDGTGKRSPGKSELLKELSELITQYGPEISCASYEKLTPTPGLFKRHFVSWLDFRFEAAKLCPYAPQYNVRRFIEITDGILMVISDLHYWPGYGASTAHRGFCRIAGKLRPKVVVINGDVADFPTTSTHRPIGFKQEPETEDEVEEIKIRVSEIEKAAPGAERYLNWGNHDLRPDNRMAEGVPKLKKYLPSILPMELPNWKFQNAIRVNDLELEIKHRNRGGQYATANNVKDAGVSYCSGHDHNCQVFRWTNLRGTFWGINTGMGAEPWGPQFEYAENNTRNWASGFAVLTFIGKKMQPPEMVYVVEPGVVFFRGERIEV